MLEKLFKKLFESLNPWEIIAECLKEIGSDIMITSYWVCLIGGLIGLILYICGYEKGKKYPALSIAIYLIIKILGAVILGVK